jgi:glycosyltransferase involved in cell wall biosynthesis
MGGKSIFHSEAYPIISHCMKALILSRYSRQGASSRLRFYQYVPNWERIGISCEVHPFLNDQYLQELYAKKGIGKRNLINCYWRLFRRLLAVRQYDFVLLEKEVFPFLPAWAEWWLNFRKVPYIVDYDDAIFHNYDLHPNKLLRRLFSRKIPAVMRRSAVVVCGNQYLAGYAKEAGAKRIALIPTVIDTERYRQRMSANNDQTLVIGWIGLPSTLKYLQMVKPVLEELTARYPLCIHIVGPKEGIGLGRSERLLDWSEKDEPGLIAAFDIGIMPLEDSPWERGKCGYKLIQYMGCGIPVVGSPVGVNEDIIQNGINGYKPVGLMAWKEALERLIEDAPLRQVLGQNGRRLVEERYSLRTGLASWIKEINHVASPRNN